MDSDGFRAGAQAGRAPADAAPLGVSVWVWSLLALALGLAATAWATRWQQQRVQEQRAVELHRVADSLRSALLEQLEDCALLARSAQTLFIASESVDAAEFDAIHRLTGRIADGMGR